jgi:hypothetical protein
MLLSAKHYNSRTEAVIVFSCCVLTTTRGFPFRSSYVVQQHEQMNQWSRIQQGNSYEGHFLSKNRFVIHTDFITHSSFFFFFFTKSYYISLLFNVVTIQIEALVQS